MNKNIFGVLKTPASELMNGWPFVRIDFKISLKNSTSTINFTAKYGRSPQPLSADSNDNRKPDFLAPEVEHDFIEGSGLEGGDAFAGTRNGFLSNSWRHRALRSSNNIANKVSFFGGNLNNLFLNFLSNKNVKLKYVIRYIKLYSSIFTERDWNCLRWNQCDQLWNSISFILKDVIQTSYYTINISRKSSSRWF